MSAKLLFGYLDQVQIKLRIDDMLELRIDWCRSDISNLQSSVSLVEKLHRRLNTRNVVIFFSSLDFISPKKRVFQYVFIIEPNEVKILSPHGLVLFLCNIERKGVFKYISSTKEGLTAILYMVDKILLRVSDLNPEKL